MSEVDAIGGEKAECYLQLISMMKELGYAH